MALVSSFPQVLFGFYCQSVGCLKILITKLNHQRTEDQTEQSDVINKQLTQATELWVKN